MAIAAENRSGVVNLPLEVLRNIARQFAHLRDVASLARTCRHLHHSLCSTLYDIDAEDENPLALLWASAKGMLRTAEYALEAGTDVDVLCDSDDYCDWLGIAYDPSLYPLVDATPFLLAARFGHLELVIRLIDAGANVEWMDCCNRTALWIAANRGNTVMVEYLLQRFGAKLNLEDKDHRLPLAAAAFSGHAALFRTLLEAAPSTMNENSLEIAAQMGQSDIFHWLLEKGVEPDTRSIQRIVHSVCKEATESRAKILKSLIIAGISLQRRHRNTALHVACGQTTAEGYQLLNMVLALDADVNVSNDRGETPLHWACGAGHVAAVRQLLDHGADPSVRSDKGDAPLKLSRAKGSTEITDLLLAHGASLAVDSKTGCRLLIYGCLSGDVALVREMLSLGVDPNSVHGCGINKTMDRLFKAAEVDNDVILLPLNMAMYKGNLTIVQLLLDAGADVTKRPIEVTPWGFSQSGNGGKSALHYKLENGPDANHLAVLELLISLGLSPLEATGGGLTPLHSASRSGVASCVQSLLERNADVHAKLYDGTTPLHFGAEAANVDVIKLLLQHGADINQPDNQGQTALHRACTSQSKARTRTIRYLLSRGADPNVKRRDDGAPPIIYLFNHTDTPEKRVDPSDALQALIDHGANVNAKRDDEPGADRETGTALHSACLCGHYEAARLLITHGADVHDSNRDGAQSLAKAGSYARAGSGCMRLLLRHGADPNAGQSKWCKPLARAVLSGSVQRTRLLVNAGACLHSTACSQAELLYFAVTANCPQLLKFLAENGLSFHVLSDRGETATQVAAAGNYNSFRFLLESGLGDLTHLDLAADMPLHARLCRLTAHRLSKNIPSYVKAMKLEGSVISE